MAQLGHNAHRFSIEWSRVEPEEGRWNDEAFERYRQMILALRAQKIEPVVTLHHFTNPVWWAQKGDWLHEDNLRYFYRYVREVAERLGPDIRYWITINEPVVHFYHSYILGVWPPGHTSLREGLRVFRNLILGHIQAYQIIHEVAAAKKFEAMVSLANHMTAVTPHRPHSPLDRFSAFLRHDFINQVVMRAVMDGFLFFPGVYCENLPGHHTLDYIGINYYSRQSIRFGGWTLHGILGLEVAIHDRENAAAVERNSLQWEVYPDGLYQLLLHMRRYSLPIMITESGICTENDEQRQRFIESHLQAVRKAQTQGVPVFGYLYWSLLDNFEWAHGFGPRFGIIHTNYETMERKIKDSAHVLSRLCR